MDERGVGAFVELLIRGARGPKEKSNALEELGSQPVWLATWEPRAEGFRTLINADGEEALAVFSSEHELMNAAARFDWLDRDGTVATHEGVGADIIRHAFTREYAFVVVDIAAEHSLEFDREELRAALRELDRTGLFKTSRPPPPSNGEISTPSSSFPPPVERVSTMYSMGPSRAERLDRLSDLPTKPHEALEESEPPTTPRAKVSEQAIDSETGRRPSSRPAAKPDSDAPPKIEEVVPESGGIDDAGTYGAASVVPPSGKQRPRDEELGSEQAGSSRPVSEAGPSLTSDVPTAPAARASDLIAPGKLPLPPIGPIVKSRQAVSTSPPDADSSAEPSAETAEDDKAEEATENRPSRLAAPSIGDSIELAELIQPPNEELLDGLSAVLRRFPEIEWASFCQVARPAGDPSPAVGLRVMDTYRDNVTAIIKELCDAGRALGLELDVLLIDGHDLLRKARERAFVFFPWKPKPFGS